MAAPVWAQTNAYGYWDKLPKPEWWPPGMSWPPPEPVGGRLPEKPEGWNDEIHGPWIDTLVQIDTARNAIERTEALQPQAPVVQDATIEGPPAQPDAPGSAHTPYTPPVQGQPQPQPAQSAPAAAPSAPAPAAAPAAAPSAQATAQADPRIPQVPPHIAGEKIFQADRERYGGSVASWSASPEGTPPAQQTFTVIYSLDGSGKTEKNTVTVTYGRSGVNGSGPFVVTGTRSNIEDASALDKYKKAVEIEEAQVRTQLTSGQLTGVELQNAERRRDSLQRQRNLIDHGREVTDKELADIQLGQQNANNGTGNTAATQANTNLSYIQAVAQILYQRGYTWDRAMQLALDQANKQAAIDQSNTNLVVNAANAIYGNDVTQRGQDVTLANNRLNAANSGFTDDVKAASSLNETLQPGSSKGADALIGMMGIRYLTAKKWGGLDPIERVKVPSTIRQLGGDDANGNPNTPIRLPGLPSPEALADQAEANLERGGVTGWPQTSNIKPPFQIQPQPQQQTARPSPSAPARPATGTPRAGRDDHLPASQTRSGGQAEAAAPAPVAPAGPAMTGRDDHLPQQAPPPRTKPMIRWTKPDGTVTYFDPSDPENAELVNSINERIQNDDLPPEWGIEQVDEGARVDKQERHDGSGGSTPIGASPATEQQAGPPPPGTKPMIAIRVGGGRTVYYDPSDPANADLVNSVNAQLQSGQLQGDVSIVEAPADRPNMHVEIDEVPPAQRNLSNSVSGDPNDVVQGINPATGLIWQGKRGDAPPGVLVDDQSSDDPVSPTPLQQVDPVRAGQEQLAQMQEEERRRKRQRMVDLYSGESPFESFLA